MRCARECSSSEACCPGPHRRSRCTACALMPACVAATGWRWPTSRPHCAAPSCSARTGAFTSTAAWTGRPCRPPPGPTCGTRARAAPPPSPCSWPACWTTTCASAPGGRSLPQKDRPGVAAQRLDQRWRKDEILEAYLNLVPFRGELVGIDALCAAPCSARRPRPGRARSRGGCGAGARAQRGTAAVASAPAACCAPCRRPRAAGAASKAPDCDSWTCSSPARCSGATRA